MRSLSFAGDEISRLMSRRVLRLATVVVMLVPLLYGALYLWAFWDPYERLADLPVALVNLDQPAKAGDATVDAGKDLEQELLDRGTFKWDVVTVKAAQQGVDDGTYYLVLTIPADFSAHLASADSEKPVQADLLVSAHESKNMLATQIGDRVFTEVRAAAAASASESYFDTVFLGFSEARDGLVTASDGATELADGLADAQDGAEQLSAGASDAAAGGAKLATGLSTLSTGAEALADGTGRLQAGARDLAGGTTKLVGGTTTLKGGAAKVASGADGLAAGLTALFAGSNKLAASATQLSAGAAQVDAGVASAQGRIGDAAAGAAQVRDGAAGVSALLAAYATAHPEAATDPTFAQAAGTAKAVADGSATLASGLDSAKGDAATLAAGAHQVASGAQQLSAGAAQLDAGLGTASTGAGELAAGAGGLSDGAGALASGAGALEDGARKAASGAGDIATGSSQLAAGLVAAQEGAVTLSDGLNQLDEGSAQLAEGLSPAVSGSAELADGLTAGVADLPAYSAEQRSAHATMMADPVALKTERIDPVPNYGTGFAPYFIPLALWVGALMVFFIVSPLPARAITSGAAGPVAALSGLWPGGLLAAAQATVMLVVLRLGLGLDPVSTPALYGFVVLTAVVFAAIMQWLSVQFGPAGKVVAIVLLMLQLTSSAGTFPLETVPEFFQAINPYLPMTYVVSGLRETISGGDWAVAAFDAWVLVAFGVAAFVGTSLVAIRARTWDPDKLKPALEI